MVILSKDHYTFLAETQAGHCLLLVNASAESSNVDVDPEGGK